MKTTQGVKLDPETRKRLEALAQIRDRSPHWLMCTAIKTYLEREEQFEHERREDNERWERYTLTGVAVAHDKVSTWLGKLAAGQITPKPDASSQP